MRQLKIIKQITQRNEESISRYFLEINKYSMICPDEEVELSNRIKNGDRVALERLVLANLRFVISVAKQYQHKGLFLSDLINEGNIGLIRAARKFDETKGFKFISYAVWWIRQSITQAISEQTRIVRLPLNRIGSINKIKKAVPFLVQELEREPTDEEVADYLDLDEDIVNTATRIGKGQVSFDKPLSQDDNNEFSLYDLIHTSNLPAPDENLLHESIEINLHRALKKLSIRESKVLSLSFGLNNISPHSLHDIAELFHMSSERVRQIRSAGLYKLKKLLTGKSVFTD